MKIAIVTGASSGLGVEFVRALKKYPADEIWIIARRRERLDELVANSGCENLVPLSYDITSIEDIKKLEERLRLQKPDVRLLINNAGKGLLSEFITADPNALADSIELNCRALTIMTRLVLPYMSKGSSIINIASIASFAPTSRMAVYGATKSFVVSFSRALREELKTLKINVTAVCAGPMKTEFLPVAKIENGKSPAFDMLPYCRPDKVAEGAIRAVAKNRAVYTPKAFYKFYRLLAKLLPHSLVIKFAKT